MSAAGVFFDARFIRVDYHDGISRFSVELFNRLARKTKVTAIICDLKQLEFLAPDSHYVLVNPPTALAELWLARKLNSAGAKVVFSPMQTTGSFGRKFKLILTLHDLIYYRHPEPPSGFSLAIRLLWRLYHSAYWPQRFLLNRADAVVTVSNTTKRLMIEHRLTKRPISVVYNAGGSEASEPQNLVERPRPKSGNKLVYMGSFMPYKNVETLISAMALLPEWELHLLSKIADNRKNQLENLVAKNARVTFHNGVTDSEYLEHLDSAVALVHASLDEGFGIPLVEAMSRGLPIVVSDIEIFREIGADAALYFRPGSASEFASSVLRLSSNPDWMHRSKLSQENAKRFDWNASAEVLLQVIERLGA